MRHIKQLLVLFLVFNVFTSCEKEEVSYALQDISAPTDVSVLFNISQDEVGLVTLTPAATGASEFHVYFGDVANETPTKVNPGQTITHIYEEEGEYSLRVIAVGLTGLTSELVRIVTVSLEAPEDLSVNIAISGTNPFEVLVTPSATNATVFDVYFGDVEDEEPTTIMASETATHEYAETGDYTVRVVARGAGATTIETSKVVTISGASNAVALPITFDDATVNYVINGFGSSDFGPIPAVVIDNPDALKINTTAKMLSINKLTDAQVWAGASIPLAGPIDFTNGTTISLKVWSPRAGTPILVKIEDSSSPKDNNGNPTVFVEIQVNSTLVNTWEELFIDLSSDANFSTSKSYDTVIVFPDFGTVGKGEMFYFDDIKLTSGDGGGEGPVVATSLPIDFESNQTFSGVFEAAQGVTGVPVTNPYKTGINTSGTVFEFTKATGAAWYSGIYQIFPQNLDLSTNQSFSIKIWSPKAGINVRMNLEKEGEGGGPAVGINQTLTQANTWVTLTYNFTGVVNASEAYDKIVIFPNFDDVNQPAGDGSVYYIDDLIQTTGGAAPTGGKTSLPINFETPSAGGTSTFNVFENVDNPPLEVVTNPDKSGVNTSETVAKFTARAAGEQYAGVETQLNTPFTMDASNSTAKIMVWKSVISDVGIQVVNASNGSTATVIKVSNTKTNEWEELTLDLTAYIGEPGAINTAKLVIFPDWGARSQDNIIYFDNVTFSAGTGGGNGGGGTSGPTAAAPTPTNAAGNVKSIFSDAYTDPAGVNYSPDWGQSTAFELKDINGNATIKYSNMNYQGIDFGGAVNASSFGFVHIDVWSADYTSLPFFLISGSGEKSVTLTLIKNQWNSFNIPLSEFTDQGLVISDLIQFKFDVQPNVGGTIFIDNLYFYKTGGDGGDGGTTGTAPHSPIDFETGGNGANWTWSVFENVSNPALEIVANPAASGNNTSSTVAKFTALQGGQPWAGVESKHGSDIGSFKFDASNKIVKIMVYKTVISDVALKFSEANGEAQPEVKVANTKINEWEELTFDMSGSIGKGATGIIDQIIIFPDFQNRTSDNVVYFDNITFGSN